MVMYFQQIVRRMFRQGARRNFRYGKAINDTDYSYRRDRTKNTVEVLRTGVSGIAVMSGIVSDRNPYEKARLYKETIRKWAENHE